MNDFDLENIAMPLTITQDTSLTNVKSLVSIDMGEFAVTLLGTAQVRISSVTGGGSLTLNAWTTIDSINTTAGLLSVCVFSCLILLQTVVRLEQLEVGPDGFVDLSNVDELHVKTVLSSLDDTRPSRCFPRPKHFPHFSWT